MIRVDDETWAALTEAAQEKGYDYRGRLNQGRVVEDLVRATQAPEPAPAASLPAAAAPVRLADVVAQWPAAEQRRWEQDKWKAGGWVKRVLDTINAGF
jgi:hypothetical protein